MTGLTFVGMVGPDSHNQEERRFVEELSSNFTVTYYLRGAGIKGLRAHQIRSIPRRFSRRRNSDSKAIEERSLLIMPVRGLARRFNAGWIRHQLEETMGEATLDWALWIRFPSPELVDAIALMPSVRVIYEPIDLYSAAEDLTTKQGKSLAEAEARLIRLATVVTGGKHLAERFRMAHGGSHWLPFGGDRCQRTTGRGAPAGISRPRLGLVGCLDWRVDEQLLVSLMGQHPDWQLILAGPRIHPWGVRLRELSNVQWLGRIPVDQVRAVIRDCDVTLIPYRITEWTRHCLPVKVFEYLAEGKPVVATPLSELELVRDGVAIVPPDRFAEAIEAALDDTSVAAQERRREVANRFSLQDRAQRAIELVQGKRLEAVSL